MRVFCQKKQMLNFSNVKQQHMITYMFSDDVYDAFLLFQLQINHFILIFKLQTKMTEITRLNNDFKTTIMSFKNPTLDPSKLRFISPQKWKNLMIKSLSVVSEYSYADKDLIHDLKFVIQNISQDKYVQAILSFQPFKPKFQSVKFLDLQSKQSRLGSTATNEQSCYQSPRTKLRKDYSIIQKGSIIIQKKNTIKKQPRTCQTIKSIQLQQKQSFLKQYLQVIIQEDTLKKQFQKKYHPFKKILDSFVFILENKFKNMVDQAKHLSLQKIQLLMTNDVLVMQKLFTKIAQPYQSIFHSQNPQEIKCFKNKMNTFFKQYIHSHQKINCAIRKVMRHYSRKSAFVLQIQKGINDFVEVQNFNIPDDFKIQGCYVESMNSLMEFAQTVSAEQSLKKLKQFRRAIARDVDHFYQSTGQLKERQINAQVQIEIVRFVLCKLKGWVPQIFGQLKFLEVVYGDQQIAYKYDDASYIYAQLITVFDALEMQRSILETKSEKSVKSVKSN